MMQRVATKQAAIELNMCILTLQHLMRQEKLPIGYAIKRDGAKRWHYIIYRDLLDTYINNLQKKIG